MTKKYLSTTRIAKMLHGADYNPDQWLHHPEILEEDVRLMKLAKCNVMSVGIFSWALLEPEEGKYGFEWLDGVLDRLAANGISVFLATPSGARPAWMSAQYPEVLRVGANRVRNLHGVRHNHCYTSPVYRDKVYQMNSRLAERYANHPAVIGWHISNEYGGECHCDYCQQAFIKWLQARYSSLDALNEAWWTYFWSHQYSSWDQIESPAPHGETQVHGQNLDWKRFVTDQTVDFCRHEIEPLRAVNPLLPVTTNFMEAYEGLNYWKFASLLDFISWDSYPTWHDERQEQEQAAWAGLNHDLFRSLKQGQPFLLMESTPSLTNWQNVSKLKRPGMHLLSSLQAVAHGSDSVQYFQWRKSRGSSEKFHGAVVDHAGHEHTRVFQDVTAVGDMLEKLDELVGTTVSPEVAIIFDTENRWAVKDSQGPRNIGVGYEETVRAHYQPFWDRGISVNVIDMDSDFTGYKLLIAPMLYMLRPGVAQRIEDFVSQGGTFLCTYWSGIVDEHDLCFLGGFPGPLRNLLGIWSEETEGLHDQDRNGVAMQAGNELGFEGTFEVKQICDLIHLETAEMLAAYTDDFYAGRPALTVNQFGEGFAYYVAARTDGHFLANLYDAIRRQANIKRVVESDLPVGVTAQMRTDGIHEYVFLLNFTNKEQQIELDARLYQDLVEPADLAGSIAIPMYGTRILKRKA